VEIGLTPLRYEGGFLLNSRSTKNQQLNGTILNNNGNYLRSWDFPLNQRATEAYQIVEFKNGSIILFDIDDELSWNFSSINVETPISYGKIYIY